MATSAEHEFWAEGSEYEDLVKTFEQNIELLTPAKATGGAKCNFCMEYGQAWCGWGSTTIEYYEYRGPDPKNI